MKYIDDAFDQLRSNSPKLAAIFPQQGNLNAYMTAEFANFLNLDQVSNVFNSVAKAVGNFFLMFFSVSFILFFFLKEENLFGHLILLLVPTKIEDRVIKVFDSISNLLKRYMIGLLFQILGVMFLSTLGFTIVGMGFSHAVIVGVFAGLLNVVPYIGPWIAGGFGVIVVIANHLNDNFNSVTLPLIFLVVVVVIIVQVIDNTAVSTDYLFKQRSCSPAGDFHRNPDGRFFCRNFRNDPCNPCLFSPSCYCRRISFRI